MAYQKKWQILQIFIGPLLLGIIVITMNTVLFIEIQKNISAVSPFDKSNPIFPLFIFSITSIALLIFAFAAMQYHAHGLRNNEKLNVQKSSFVRMAADTLRTPLTGLRWMTELMLTGEMGKLSKSQQESVTSMGSAFERIIDLTNELLEVMRMSGGVVQYHPHPTDVLELIRDTKKDSEAIAGTKGVHVGFGQISHDTYIMLDAPLIRHALSSLITGVMHLAKRASTLVIHTEPHTDQIAIGITYTGAKIITKNFDLGKNKQSNLSIVPANLGELDLSISWEILEAANASFWTVSKNTEHTLFIGLPNIPAKITKKESVKKEEKQEGVERFLKDAKTEIEESTVKIDEENKDKE